MSRYLIRRIEETSAITLLPHTEIIALGGGDHLDHLPWRNNQTGETQETCGCDNGCVGLDDMQFE